MSPVDEKALLQQGIAAARAGDKASARARFRELTAHNFDNELAWLWLASVADTPAHAIACLRRVLQIKQSVLGACRIRYLRCPVDHLPSIPELQLLVPQQSGQPRGPLPAPTMTQARDQLASAVASRRRQRNALWQDSSFFHDSFFGADTRSDGLVSDFGALRSGVSVREVPPGDSTPSPFNPATPPPPLRH